jgi:hypothetical protein
MKKKMMIAGIVAAMAITGAAANMGAATADQDIDSVNLPKDE